MKKKTVKRLMKIVQYSDVPIQITPIIKRDEHNVIYIDYKVETLLRDKPETLQPGNTLRSAPGTQSQSAESHELSALKADYQRLARLSSAVAQYVQNTYNKPDKELSKHMYPVVYEWIQELRRNGFLIQNVPDIT